MNTLFVVGLALFTGFIFGELIKYIKLPSVTGYIIGGLIVGSSFLNLIPYHYDLSLTWVINFALIIVAFNVAGELNINELKKLGTSVLIIVLFEALMTFVFISLFVYLTGVPMLQALLIGSIGAATAPPAIMVVIQEYKARGPVSQILLICTGLDDAIGLTLYAIMSSTLISHSGGAAFSVLGLILHITIGLLISIFIGALAALLLQLLSRFANSEVAYIALTLGILISMGGLMQNNLLGFELSPLLAAMTTGFIITNWSRDRKHIFNSIDSFGRVFYILFFVLAAARLKIRMLIKLGKIAIGYLLGRFVGKYAGTFLGGKISHAPSTVTKYAGIGLISQAGIAIGLCVVAAQQFPNISDLIVSIALGTTIVTEIVSPLLTKIALQKGNEINLAK